MKSKYTIHFPQLLKNIWIHAVQGYPLVVKDDSPKSLRRQVELCARYFLREGYSDFLCFDAEEMDGAIAILFTQYDCDHAIGAACFRQRTFENFTEQIWFMHWAWIHPFARNKGLLGDHLYLFEDLFGYWYPEWPHSAAMQHFIKKHQLKSPKAYAISMGWISC